jgi:hypothetical protein
MRFSKHLPWLVIVPLVVGCSDLPLLEPSSQRLPAGLEIETDAATLVAGATSTLRLVLRDQHGTPFEYLPPWATPVWSVTDERVIRFGAAGVEAASPGEAEVRVNVAGQSAALRMRVNPAAIRLGTHAYVTQGVQRWDGSMPLVAGRDAVVRVFLSADQLNFFDPVLRVRFFRDGAEVHTLTAPGRDGVPVQVREHVLASSYNVVVPGALLQPGTALLVEALTEGHIPLLGGSVARFPASGEAMPLDVRDVAPFRIRFVPVVQPDAPVAGISPANVGQFMWATHAVYPLNDVEVDVRAPYHSTASTSTQSGWSQLLNEIRVLRLAESDGRYYHGIVRRIAHWAGLGYIGHPVALSYDALPAANWTVAHELGHNFGRFHAPCGDPAGVDAAFPYPDGGIGVYGLSFSQGQVHPPATPDLMGYCTPRWISDYTYLAVAAFREEEARRAATATASSTAGPGLIIWGRIVDGNVTLEPPIRVARLLEPPRPGPYRVEGVDAAGGIVFAADFAADRVSEGADGERHFAFTIPLDDARAGRLATLRMRGGGVRAEVSSAAAGDATPMQPNATAPPATPSPQPRARAAAGQRVELSWDAGRHPLVVVRDARSGAVISLARGGRMLLATDAPELQLELSDGVRSSMQRIAVER